MTEGPAPTSALGQFTAPTRNWFAKSFAAPTSAQEGAWTAIQGGQHAVVVAPTGSGKTLSAFLWAIDELMTEPVPEAPIDRCRILYVSPLKALAADIERNLRSPLVGISQTAAAMGLELPAIKVGTRTGDTSPSERRSFGIKPPDILITTPESLFLILTSSARAGLAGVRTVILDEIHAVAGTKRGAHLALSLERLDELTSQPVQRIGLSATVNPVDAVATFLAGARTISEGGREVVIVQPPSTKKFVIDIEVPVPDLADLDTAPTPKSVALSEPAAGDDDADLTGNAGAPAAKASIWPHLEERIVDLVTMPNGDARTTLVFTNSRRGAERLTSRLNEIWANRHGADLPQPGEIWASEVTAQSGVALGAAAVLARAHHGSMSRLERTRIEEDLKSGELPVVVATSSLELGIDMGAIDLVIQVAAPPSVASGLQRIGRAGHHVGATSHGVVLPTFRGDLIQATVVADRMRKGEVERLAVLSNPLDVLAQHIVSMTAMDDWTVDEVARVVRRAAPWSGLGDRALTSVLDMLSGAYPSEDFGELRPRIVWDRITGSLTARPGAARLAVTSGGTIPDRGLYGVFLVGEGAGRRVGELDEEMVYESRVGDVFTLGTSSWRIEDITPDRVLVSPAPGRPGRLPFWKGDGIGRPAELGEAIGSFVRELAALPGGVSGPAARETLVEQGLDDWAISNLTNYLSEQAASTGSLPDDRTIVVERFRDELGDWRLVIHSPYGARVHTPWALAIAGRMRDAHGIDVQVMPSNDGIVLRLPDTDLDDEGLPDALASAQDVFLLPEEVEPAVTEHLGSSALFAARFREASARALLLPRRRPDRRQPLWQQRHRASQLLTVASSFEDFPIIHEAIRECLQDVFDVPALTDLMNRLSTRSVRVVEVTTQSPSPFAQSLLFGYVAQFLYDGDTPMAERRAAALSLDPALLAELLGSGGPTSLADLLVPEVVELFEAERQCLAPERAARTIEHVADMLRRLGPLTHNDIAARTVTEHRDAVTLWLEELRSSRRIIEVRIAGRATWAAAEDASRLRDGLGVALPVGIPDSFLRSVPDPLGDLALRHGRSRGPFTAQDFADRFGLGVALTQEVLGRLSRAGRFSAGKLRPEDARTVEEQIAGLSPAQRSGEDEFCETEVLRLLRKRSLASLRAEVEPVEPTTLGRFLPRWQGIVTSGGATWHGATGLSRVIEQLAGVRAPASAWESLIFPSRLPDYRPELLDELTTSGEVVWRGHGRIPGHDGWISFHPAATAELTLPDAEPAPSTPLDATTARLRACVVEVLARGGGHFTDGVAHTVQAEWPDQSIPSAAAIAEVLWDLAWTGVVTNDTFAAVRATLDAKSAHKSKARTPRGRASLGHPGPGRSLSGLRSLLAESVGAEGESGSLRGSRSGRLTDSALGRWSLLPEPTSNPTLRARALATVLLDRHGIVTRSIASTEHVGGGFANLYRVLAAMEEQGQLRRGYFVESLGAAQFAIEGTVDLLRDISRTQPSRTGSAADPHKGTSTRALALAATDPASPYGAALPWPAGRTGHRPGRKAGAIVVLVDGELALYLERGARSLLTFDSTARDDDPEPTTTTDEERAALATGALSNLVDSGRVPSIAITTIDGQPALADRSTTHAALLSVGFTPTPQGLRRRGRGA